MRERDALASQLEQEREVSERLMTELNDINGPTSMGEPVLPASSMPAAQALTDAAKAMKGERGIIYNQKGWDYAIRFLEERAARLRSASPRRARPQNPPQQKTTHQTGRKGFPPSQGDEIVSEYECPNCGPKWNGCYTLEHRCVTCGEVIRVAEPWREESEKDVRDDA